MAETFVILGHLRSTLAAVSLFVMAGCNSEDYDKVVDETKRLENQLNELGAKLSNLRVEESDLELVIWESERNQKRKSEMLKQIGDLDTYKGELEASIEIVDSKVRPWTDATRKSLVGELLGTVRLADGRTLADAKVNSLSEELVRLDYEGGSEEFQLSELPPDLRRSLIHEATIALESKLNP